MSIIYVPEILWDFGNKSRGRTHVLEVNKDVTGARSAKGIRTNTQNRPTVRQLTKQKRHLVLQ